MGWFDTLNLYEDHYRLRANYDVQTLGASTPSASAVAFGSLRPRSRPAKNVAPLPLQAGALAVYARVLFLSGHLDTLRSLLTESPQFYSALGLHHLLNTIRLSNPTLIEEKYLGIKVAKQLRNGLFEQWMIEATFGMLPADVHAFSNMIHEERL